MTSTSAPEPSWVKSSFSVSNGECVELTALENGMIGVRDSKDPDGAILRFTRGELAAFALGIRAGEFENLY